MSEYSKENVVSDPPQNESVNMAAVLKDIQQRLVFLERKIDTLLSQSLERQAFKERNFSKSPRAFGRFNRHNKGRHDNGPRGESFSQSQPRHFDRPREEGNQGFGSGKKHFFHRGHGNFSKKSSHK